MSRAISLLVVSDIHFAGAAEKALGHPRQGLTRNPVLNLGMAAWDRLIWMRDPLAHAHLLDRFIADAPEADIVVANGDFSVDSASIGLADAAAMASAIECVGKLRARFGPRLHATIGDHELGKKSFIGDRGGMRLASWPRTVDELGLKPAWSIELGNFVLIGVTSSLIGLELLRHDLLAAETAGWETLREAHMAETGRLFAAVRPEQRILLFCHDPSALPFLLEVPSVRARLGQIERTIVGHLHSDLFFRTARALGGMPRVTFMGNTLRRWTAAVNRAGGWRPFRPILCPALAGIELTRCGGWLEVRIDPEAKLPAQFERRVLRC